MRNLIYCPNPECGYSHYDQINDYCPDCGFSGEQTKKEIKYQ